MRCLALLTDAFGGEGGIARFNRDLLTALAAAGVNRVDALCRHSPRQAEALPAGVTQAAAGAGRWGYALRALTRSASAQPYDFVLCSHLHLAPVAAAAAMLQRAPLWVHLHGIEAWQRPVALRARAVRRAALVTAVSRYTRARFLSWADLPPERVRVLPCTVDDRFTPGPKPQELAVRLGVQGRRVLLTVSRIDRGDRYKGHDRVLGALRALAARRADIDYVIVGDGDDRGRLEQRVRDLGLDGRVHFAGAVRDSELPDYYRLADAFVMPSTKEGFGIVFLEALASGIPAIGGAADGARDALADGQLGALVDPGSERQLCDAIEAALGTRSTAAEASRFGAPEFRAHVRGLAEFIAGAPHA